MPLVRSSTRSLLNVASAMVRRSSGCRQRAVAAQTCCTHATVHAYMHACDDQAGIQGGIEQGVVERVASMMPCQFKKHKPKWAIR